MKKNLMTVIILALVLVNLVLTAILAFTIIPQTRKSNQLIDKIASAIDLELEDGSGKDTAAVPVEDIEVYDIESSFTVNLSPSGDGKDHVAVFSIGLSLNTKSDILDVTVPELPQDKPIYLMGVGTPQNILEAVERGVDFFDCVYPARNGRHGHAYTNHGKMNLQNKKYELDDRPIEVGCGCPACRHYSRAYIRHLLKAKEMLGLRLLVLHNLYFYNTMMEEIREAIETGTFSEYKKNKLARMEAGLDV